MLLINDCFMTHTFTPKIQEFLAMLKQKAASGKHAHGGFQEACLDELYGILPPLGLKWYMAPDKKYHRQIREWGPAFWKLTMIGIGFTWYCGTTAINFTVCISIYWKQS